MSRLVFEYRLTEQMKDDIRTRLDRDPAFYDYPGPRGNQQSWQHLDEVGRSELRAPDNKPEQQDEREYLE
jgi:hypothetical protein